jgi:hypothetical protein
MVRTQVSQTSLRRLALRLAFGAGAVLLVSGTFALVAPRQAQATPAYAQKTGKPCGYCHVSPGGGGPLKAAGKKFQKNGHKL